MLATLMTVLFFMVKAVRQLSRGLFHEEPLPYLVHQPPPWQVQYVTQSRRTSRDGEKGGSSRHNSIYTMPGRSGDGGAAPSGECEEWKDPLERAAVTIQTHYRKYQQHKQGL
ncbi:uncharacterized protein LOC125441789 isoform X3 [Sphaerodactylus townsendi]|uniref:uncharacterized protein LOC125441789 isoform X3 n=1 Tax=Sphaerodactylus townsendi TaxID=933632 RepID=UPI0020267594|nr:uncharacterized protein LOC125441789 isoform X3 [Sphaerodactylus townsendi]